MSMSKKLTFSLASLVLIFALAFVAPLAMAATGGPTVDITEDKDPVQTRDAFKLTFTFSDPVETVDATNGQLAYTYWLVDSQGGRLAAEAAAGTAGQMSGSRSVYEDSLTISNQSAVSIIVNVAADAKTGV